MIAHRLSRFEYKSEATRVVATCANAQSGFSLIEVLVAVVVLSFGLLGMVGVQAFAMQANRDSRQQAQAASLARELSELMRNNSIVALQTTTSANPYLFDSSTGAINEGCLGVANAAAGCADTTSVARSEMMDWLLRVNQALPGARIVVCFDRNPYDSAGLPRWGCDSSSADVERTAIIKLGWTRNSLDRSKTGASVVERADAQSSTPYIIVPVTSGNS